MVCESERKRWVRALIQKKREEARKRERERRRAAYRFGNKAMKRDSLSLISTRKLSCLLLFILLIHALTYTHTCIYIHMYGAKYS